MTPLYNHIGIGYDRTRKADPFIVERLFHHLAPEGDGLYLDIGCGTGNYTDALQRKGLRFIGIDPSVEMLEKAGRKNGGIDWRTGSAEQTGLASGSVDGIIGTLTIHHWLDLPNAFAELGRVAKPGARLVIFTSLPEQTAAYWLRHYFPKMIADSARSLPLLVAIEEGMSSGGFGNVRTEPYGVRPDLADLFLYSGKYDPELYFSPEVRSGISSFAAVANREEVEEGLRRLREDIDGGKISEVIRGAEQDRGDYLFVVAEKICHTQG